MGPAILELAQWGLKWAMGERRETETFHPGWAVLGLRACFNAEAAAGLRAVPEFRVDDEVFHARIDSEALHSLKDLFPLPPPRTRKAWRRSG
ncbi:hypothetical protein ACFV2X_26470 [Streptomyces sp. NPDC059679]|uniref:hypothetical protein n=1 Tax=Streptomyces sp. NPDC059679 TaxID=3346903 RepID=UPI003697B34C